MRVAHIAVKNYRGIKDATILLPKHGVLIGDNNTGKTTVLEALDLVLGPDRLNRYPPIDEHDFFQGQYTADNTLHPDETEQSVPEEHLSDPHAPQNEPATDTVTDAPRIEIEATVVDLTDEQVARFGDYLEFWDSSASALYTAPNLAGVDGAHIAHALRVTFQGAYDADEDDFTGRTFYSRSLTESDQPQQFTRKDKQVCGFLYLRSLRTGSRALSLQRGSLLDIILRLKEVRPQMWEAALGTLSRVPVASDPALGISHVLESIDAALKKYVPREWGVQPHLKVSSLTREHLRQVITAFIATGEEDHAAPYFRQGTGTINMLVLAMLSQIAEDKQNVIFAMEEPETAVPPYAQKRIVHEVRQLASQTLFTSHSPYVLEEFETEETVVLQRNADGLLRRHAIALPGSVKLKRYQQEFRTRFCEGLLARRVLIAEGATESSAFPAACRRLAELQPSTYSSLEALGICTIDAGSETNIPDMAKLYRGLGKQTFAICDKQGETNKALIEEQVEVLLMHDQSGFEDLVLSGTAESATARFAGSIDWPAHLQNKHQDLRSRNALRDYFRWSKGRGGITDFLASCGEGEIPEWLRAACRRLKDACALESTNGDQRQGTAVSEAGGDEAN